MIVLREEANAYASELEKKNDEYLEYLEKHIGGVVEAFKKYFIPLIDSDSSVTVGNYTHEEFIYAIKKKALSIDKHDLSKYNDLEYSPYRRYYYPTLEEQNASEENKAEALENYEKAWQHHYEHNMHHIEYWYDFKTSTPKDMDLESIIEMICDWTSLAYYFGNSMESWWRDQKECAKERSMMTEYTIQIVNDIYDIITK